MNLNVKLKEATLGLNGRQSELVWDMLTEFIAVILANEK